MAGHSEQGWRLRFGSHWHSRRGSLGRQTTAGTAGGEEMRMRQPVDRRVRRRQKGGLPKTSEWAGPERKEENQGAWVMEARGELLKGVDPGSPVAGREVKGHED